MSNMFFIARKEFSDLLNNWMVLIVLGVFLFFVCFSAYNFYDAITNPKPNISLIYGEKPGIAMLNYLFILLTTYGSFVGITIGCSSISNERHGNAINTLIVKPLYRDTIINGKVIGICCFFLCLFTFTIILYTSLLLILSGSVLSSTIIDFVVRLPIVLFISIIYVMVFVSLSILISLTVKDQAYGWILSLILLYVDASIAGSLAIDVSQIFGENQYYIHDLIMTLSPSGMMPYINNVIFNLDINIISGLLSIKFEIFKLILYILISFVLSYILFVRSDIK